MAIIGYARVSSTGQSLGVQHDKLSDAGCERVFAEKRSGVTASRPQLELCLDFVREGDVLVITKLDRLARSTLDLHRIAALLNGKGVGIRALDQSFDTTTAEGRLVFSMLACFAEFENDLRRERQTDGIARARDKGVKFGRRPALTDDQVAELRERRAAGVKIKELMNEYGLSKATVYRALQESGDS